MPPRARPPLPDADHLREQVQAMSWYHTIELADGVVTPGWFDTRATAGRLPWPDLTGLRCLDVGTFDGFWAFEMERRGGQVLAIDLLDPAHWDWPPGSAQEVRAAIGERKRGDGFVLARAHTGSTVERQECSVYDLDPERHGEFDFVYVGSLLLHLRDPVRALERVRRVCRGTALVVDAVELSLSTMHPWRPLARLDAAGRPWWWRPNAAGLARMLRAAGFEVQRGPRLLRMPRGQGQPTPPTGLSTLRSPAGRNAWFIARFGDPHAWVLARSGSRA